MPLSLKTFSEMLCPLKQYILIQKLKLHLLIFITACSCSCGKGHNNNSRRETVSNSVSTDTLQHPIKQHTAKYKTDSFSHNDV